MPAGRWYLLAAVIGIGAPVIATQVIDSGAGTQTPQVLRGPTYLDVRPGCAGGVTEGVADVVDGIVVVGPAHDGGECTELILLELDATGPIDVVVDLDDRHAFRCPSAPEAVPPALNGPFPLDVIGCPEIAADLLGQG